MPVYNVAPYVERALLSALNQTFDSIEFLIVDDRGTDNSMDIVRKIVAEHPRGKDVRIIEHPHNIGTGATKNTAIDNAKGKYLFFMDSDDEITPDCIEVLYKAMMEDGPVDFVAGSYDIIDIEGNIKSGLKYKRVKMCGRLKLAESVFRIRDKFSITTWNKLYDIDFLRSNHIKCYPHHLNEDNIFTFDVILKSDTCILISEITLRQYQRENSTEYNRRLFLSVRNVREFMEIYSYYKSSLYKYNEETVYLSLLSWIIASMCNFCHKIYSDSELSYIEKKYYIKRIMNIDVDFKSLFGLFTISVKNYYYVVCLFLPYRLKVVALSLLG